MRYLLLLAVLCLVGCEPPQSFEDDDMTNRNPMIAPAPIHGIPQVAPVIPRDGLWSGYNQLGYQAKYGPDDRGTQTILKLDTWGPPEVWTISLFIKGSFASFNGFNIKATINFGAGGSTQIYKCDWLNGTQISLPMNAVNVVADFSDVDIVTEGKSMQVGVQLARGARGGTRPPILTFLQGETLFKTPSADNSTENFELPAFARRVVALPGAMTAAERAIWFSTTTELNLLSGNAIGTINTGQISGDMPSENGAIVAPVSGASRLFNLANLSAAQDIIIGSLYVELDG